jgi:biotin transport system permease protein
MTTPAAALLGAYLPGTSWLHRLPAGAKLLALFAIGVLTVLWRGPVASLVVLAVAVVVFTMTGASWRLTLRGLRGLMITLALLAAYHVWQNGTARAVEVLADLVALILLATALTVTTPVDELIDAIVRGLRPLQPLGVRPESVALAFSLMIRAIPTTLVVAQETRDAAIARGLDRNPRARLTPLVIRVVANARTTGDALHARGIGDD